MVQAGFQVVGAKGIIISTRDRWVTIEFGVCVKSEKFIDPDILIKFKFMYL